MEDVSGNETCEQEIVTMHVDYREKYASWDPSGMSCIQHCNNPVGDFVIYLQSAPILVIERKTVSDLAASIVDGRYRCQKDRMFALVGNDPRRVMYILEGFRWSVSDDAWFHGISGKALKTVAVDLQVVHGCSVICTLDPHETWQAVMEIFSRIRSSPDKYSKPMAPSASTIHVPSNAVMLKKSDNLADPRTAAVMQLSLVPRVSPKTAECILKDLNCNSMIQFVELCRDLGPEDAAKRIAAVKAGARALGRALAERVVVTLGFDLPSTKPPK